MSFGIGAFPFGFFTSTFNFGEARPSAGMKRCFVAIIFVS
jgi:E3 ubiquitin-protein ligase RNF5